MLALFRAQPPAFRMIFMLEIWERFGFYTMQGILTLFFIRFLGFNDKTAYFVFGTFSALAYCMVPIGGYLGDKILGTKRTIILGLILLALGYLFLAFANKTQVFLALGLICVGSGIFKANPSNLLAKCYGENDSRLHGGFTLYYMSINLGSTFSLFLGPSVSTHFGYVYAYFLSFIGLVFGLLNYWLQRKYIANINTEADKKKISLTLWAVVISATLVLTFASAYLIQHIRLAQNLVWLATAIVVGIYLNLMRKEKKRESLRMFVAFILMVEAILFFTLYQQMPTSLNLFAINNVNPKLLGIPLDPQSFQALNPIWIMIISPLLAMLYNKLDANGVQFSIPYKFAAGMFCCGLSFSLLYFARYFHNSAGLVSSWWLVASYFFQSTGELLVSALGVAMVAELVPIRITGFVMGMWFLTTSISGFLGASVASFTALPAEVLGGVPSLHIYTQVFAYIGLVSLAIAVLMWLSSAYLDRYIH